MQSRNTVIQAHPKTSVFDEVFLELRLLLLDIRHSMMIDIFDHCAILQLGKQLGLQREQKSVDSFLFLERRMSDVFEIECMV